MSAPADISEAVQLLGGAHRLLIGAAIRLDDAGSDPAVLAPVVEEVGLFIVVLQDLTEGKSPETGGAYT